MTFRLTFNKPMISLNFGGEQEAAVRIKIEDGIVSFLPVMDASSPDALPISVRTRGGGEAYVEGNKATELRAALTNEVSPFFTLQRQEGGWLVAVPWMRDVPPPKPVPHVRGWTPTEGAEALTKDVDFNNEALDGFVSLVQNARQTMAMFAEEKRPGRPPKEIVEARSTLALADRLVEIVGQPVDGRFHQSRELIDQALRTPSRRERMIAFAKKSDLPGAKFRPIRPFGRRMTTALAANT